MKILVLGVSGMLGHMMFRTLSRDPVLDVWGTARNSSVLGYFPDGMHSHIETGLDVMDTDCLVTTLGRLRPDVIINCVGLIKQLGQSNDPLLALPINSILPHRLARLAALSRARLVHISTDCVFSGKKGSYCELDQSDATDLYGKSKFIGEVDYPNAITLRTSIIGPELSNPQGLIGWFLSQDGPVKGFTRAIFSGLPTSELASVIGTYVLKKPELTGVYHVAAAPISKFELLEMVGGVYGKPTMIVPDDKIVIDRSLDASRFESATGYNAPEWPDLVARMREHS